MEEITITEENYDLAVHILTSRLVTTAMFEEISTRSYEDYLLRLAEPPNLGIFWTPRSYADSLKTLAKSPISHLSSLLYTKNFLHLSLLILDNFGVLNNIWNLNKLMPELHRIVQTHERAMDNLFN